MNQKLLRYVLIGSVALVWGLIIYRIIDGLGADNEMPLMKTANAVTANYPVQADSFSLIADYPDPFIPDVDTVDSPLTVATAIAPIAPPPMVGPPVNNTPPPDAYKEGNVQYMGMIANPKKKLKIATISINGKEVLVKEKDKVEGYSIVKITAEAIEIRYKGKKITVTRTQ